MAEELFGGDIASEMTLGGAIAQGILPVPECVASIYKYNAELKKYQRRINMFVPMFLKLRAQKQLDILCRSLPKAQTLDEPFRDWMHNRQGKYIIFCSSWEHLQEVRKRIGEETRRYMQRIATAS